MIIRIFISFVFLILVANLVTSYSAEAQNDQIDDELEVVIKGLTFDQMTQTPIVLLENKEDKSIIPIWIGICEARSIEIGRSGFVPPRPLTYDLVAAIIRTLKANVNKIVIADLRDQIYYAQVEISVNGTVSKIDARPSDAIALAERMNSPIFVKKSVLDKAAVSSPEKEKRGI